MSLIRNLKKFGVLDELYNDFGTSPDGQLLVQQMKNLSEFQDYLNENKEN